MREREEPYIVMRDMRKGERVREETYKEDGVMRKMRK